MISEQDKQQILNGAYGITRNGVKAKYIGTYASNDYPYYFIFLNKDDEVYHTAALTDSFEVFKHATNNLDIVGLWKEPLEPFNLEKALQGEPVMFRDGNKGVISCNLYNFIKDNIKLDDMYPLKGIRFYKQNEHIAASSECWTLEGKLFIDPNEDSPADIIGMWKDPEPVSKTVTLTLPCPLKEPREGMAFFIARSGQLSIDISQYEEKNPDSYSKIILEEGGYFATKEDVQAWLDAMKNNRR